LVATRSTSFDWTIENAEAFQKKLDELGNVLSDFRIPFKLIASDFYKSNRKIFTLQSAGLYQDLAPSKGIDGNPTTTSNYKKKKERKLGFAYPILVGETRELSNSILGGRNKGSVFTLRKQALLMGTRVDHAKYHQGDGIRKKIPQRKFVFIDGGPADKSSDSSINGRRERWTSIIDEHIKQIVTGRVR